MYTEQKIILILYHILATQRSGVVGAVSASNGNNGQDAGSQSLQVTLNNLKQDVNALKAKIFNMQVDEALENVRILASRPKLTSPYVLLAAVETLVSISHKTNHKEACLFSKAYSTCKKYGDNDDLCGLVLKLFYSQEYKKIANVVADWAKLKKYEESGKGKENPKENANIFERPSVNNFQMPGYGITHPYGTFGMHMPYPMFSSPPMPSGQSFMVPGRPQYYRGEGVKDQILLEPVSTAKKRDILFQTARRLRKSD